MSGWDGVVRHVKVAGVSGYRRWGCRCPECAAAGAVYREKEKRRESKARANAKRNARIADERRAAGLEFQPAKRDFAHGETGYRNHACRCETCLLGHQNALDAKRSRDAERRGQVSEQPVDWSDVLHLVPGHALRQRKAG